MSDLGEIVRSPPPDYVATAQAVADHLRDQADRGIAEASAFFREARDEAEARYPADHVGALPDHRDAKRALVELALDERPDLLGAVTQPLRGAGAETAKRVALAHLDAPTEATEGAIYEAARFFPDAVREYAERLDDDEDLRLALLPGAPDDVVAKLEAAYEDDPDEDTLLALSKVRTAAALEVLIDIAGSAPDRERLELYIESSGVFPDTRTASVWFDAFRGFVVRRGAAPHEIGPGLSGPRPVCPVCCTPSTRVLTLAASELSFDLRTDPSFFWFSCEHDAIPYLYVDFSGDVREGMMVPMGDGEPEQPLLPEASLVLETHPSPRGFGVTSPSGYALNQVGGFPPWIQLTRHPHCPKCSTSMHFLAALDSGPSELGPVELPGILYGFWCDDCAVSCTMKQGDELYE